MLKLISINIQTDLHHDRVIPFLQKEQPDVVCLQEVFKEELAIYEKALNMTSYFKPMCLIESFIKADGKNYILGPAILTKHQVKFSSEYIVGTEEDVPIFEHKFSKTERDINNLVVLWADVKDTDGDEYRISTTHFTWTPEGLSTEYQKNDMKKLIEVLDNKLKGFILTGDLNAPRGNETFSMLSEKYKDNIPAQYTSSLDPNLHRVKGLVHMVDGLFSTPEYNLKNVELHEGVSDHKAIVAYIEKVK